jgi:hypothetical protein
MRNLKRLFSILTLPLLLSITLIFTSIPLAVCLFNPGGVQFYALPASYRGSDPASNPTQELHQQITVTFADGSTSTMTTPFSLNILLGVTIAVSCSGAVGWDYYGTGWNDGSFVTYTITQGSTKIAAFFSSYPIQFFSLPVSCLGTDPANNAGRDLHRQIIVTPVWGVSQTYVTPFSLNVPPGTTITVFCSGASGWDYYGVGWKVGSTATYTFRGPYDMTGQPVSNNIAAFFSTS